MKTGLAALLLIVLAAAAAPLYAHLVGTDPFRTDILGQVAGIDVLAEGPGGLGTVPVGPGLLERSWRLPYLLGADALGRDVAARLLYASRTSLLVAALATALALVFGTLAGTVAGAGTRGADWLVSALVDLLWAFPATLLAISLALVLAKDGSGAASGPLLPAAIIGAVLTPYVARPVRAALRALAPALFLEAARATGGSRAHILRRHLLPQLAPLLAGLAPVVAAAALLTEAALSALGIGIAPPGCSWGTLIADGIGLMHLRPAVALAPGVALSATVLALNAVAESLRAPL